jgi:hypothetical protein
LGNVADQQRVGGGNCVDVAVQRQAD